METGTRATTPLRPTMVGMEMHRSERPYSPTIRLETGSTQSSSRMTAVQMRRTAMATP